MKENKILLVTGASSDIGGKLIRRIQNNYSIILAHYNSSIDQIMILKDDIGDKIVPIQADFSDVDSVLRMITKIKEMGTIPDHIVHLSAQKYYIQKFSKELICNFADAYRISVDSITSILLEFVPYMVRQHYGKIIFMLSSNVLNQPAKYQTSYTMVKYALLGFMKSLAVEYADKGITANGVSPDMVETKYLSDIPEIIISKNAQMSPLNRNLTVEDIIPAFEYMLSDDADAVTGVNLPITGGNL